MRSILDSTAIDFTGRTRYYVAVPGERMRKVLIILGIAGLLAAGCVAAPSKRVTGYSASAGDKAADTALTMVGRPYQLKGETPGGFDCSGLVRYSYLMAGMDVPHGTSALRNSTRSVGLRNARKGDLLFFIQEGKNYSHVGIYVGNDQFVHAPSTGGHVRRDSITDPYWEKHYLDTRRFL
jgi:cell wall-associated NlpC family hydrolase